MIVIMICMQFKGGRSKEYLLQRIAIAVQRGNAAAVFRTAGRQEDPFWGWFCEALSPFLLLPELLSQLFMKLSDYYRNPLYISMHTYHNYHIQLMKTKEKIVKCSNGWFSHLKQRRGIASQKLHVEASSVDPVAVQAGRDDLKSLLSEYRPCDVYNV